MRVSTALFRLHLPVLLGTGAVLLLAELTGLIIITWAIDLRFSLWVAMAGSMARFWSVTIGIILVAMNLRQFVANGVTRREFASGAGVFALAIAVGFGVVVPVGHWVEGLVMGAIGERGAGYPVLSAVDLLGDFARMAPQAFACLVSGGLIAIGFYRFRARLGLLVMLLGALPAVTGDAMMSVDEQGRMHELLPFLPALLVTLAVTGLAVVALRRLSRDVAIRRTAG
jgi:hypothetical protein